MVYMYVSLILKSKTRKRIGMIYSGLLISCYKITFPKFCQHSLKPLNGSKTQQIFPCNLNTTFVKAKLFHSQNKIDNPQQRVKEIASFFSSKKRIKSTTAEYYWIQAG